MLIDAADDRPAGDDLVEVLDSRGRRVCHRESSRVMSTAKDAASIRSTAVIAANIGVVALRGYGTAGWSHGSRRR